MKLEGIHHVTCITGDAVRNVDFYTRVLGLRLVAKSVNQDDPYVYHLFFSDEEGHPGADITFFAYQGAVRGRAGAGMVHRVLWRVGSPEALAFWAARLEAAGVAVRREGDGLTFDDPEGLEHELVVNATADRPLVADHPEIPPAMALQGFEGVRAYGSAARSGRLIEDVLAGRKIDDRTFEMRGQRRGGWIAFDDPPAGRGIQGAGSVHHVAWGTTMAEHPKWHERLIARGVHATPVIDRHYFHSIYFREPGGVLFEIADDGPGFAVDGTVEDLGAKLILPPWYEPRRAEIEARLVPLPDPRAGWKRAERG
jgi:glyoxalase family protein